MIAKCEDCQFSRPNDTKFRGSDLTPKGRVCYRYPQKIAVDLDHWCGEFRPTQLIQNANFEKIKKYCRNNLGIHASM